MMKQPTPEQIEAAICLLPHKKCAESIYEDYILDHGSVIEFALRFLQKAMGEPSFDVQFVGGSEIIRHAMTDSGTHETSENVFKAMRDQMLNEMNDDN